MLAVPMSFNDNGYYNPEGAAWLANYYSQWEAHYGGGGDEGGGGGWNSHASTSGILGYRWTEQIRT